MSVLKTMWRSKYFEIKANKDLSNLYPWPTEVHSFDWENGSWAFATADVMRRKEKGKKLGKKDEKYSKQSGGTIAFKGSSD